MIKEKLFSRNKTEVRVPEPGNPEPGNPESGNPELGNPEVPKSLLELGFSQDDINNLPAGSYTIVNGKLIPNKYSPARD